MNCPFCDCVENKVVDSRASKNGKSVRRRRECLSCAKRFTTYEYIEPFIMMVVKKDGRREEFDRNKIKAGVMLACKKLPISMDCIDEIVDSVEKELASQLKSEVQTQEIGESVMRNLFNLNKVAYIRFASVYRCFSDTGQFLDAMREIQFELKDGNF